MNERIQTLGEEIANSLSHGLALVAAIASLPFLVTSTSHLSVFSVVGACVFGGTMVLLYFTSSVYHALPQGRTKRVFLKLDYCAIYLFIAGSYTPFALGVLKGPWGWTLFGLVWGLALIGIVLKASNLLSRQWLSTGLYLVMGWLVLIAAVPLAEHLPLQGLLWLVAGGLAYTVGVIFFILDHRIRYSHTIWHGFVAAGSALHFVAVISYAGSAS